MKILERVINKLKNNLYYRMVAIYSAIIIGSLLIVLSIFIGNQRENIRESQKQKCEVSVTQFKNFTDQSVLDSIYPIMTKYIFLSDSSNKEIIGDALAYHYDSNNFLHALKVQKFLVMLKETKEYIDSINIYNRDYDTYISSKSGIFYNVSKKVDTYSKFVDYRLLNNMVDKKFNLSWIAPAQNKMFYNGQGIASFVQLMPTYLSSEEYKLAICININIEQVFKSYLSNLDKEIEEFKIIDGENQLIFDTNTDELLANNQNQELLQLVEGEATGYKVIKQDGERKCIVWQLSTINNWKYIYITREENLFDKTLASMQYILIGFFILCIVILYMTIRLTEWLYKPLGNLVNASCERLEENTLEGDLSTISKAFYNIDSKLGKLQDIVNQNDMLILNNIIHDLINGKMSKVNELNDRLKLINRMFQKDSFYVFLVKPDPRSYKLLADQEKDILHITMNEVILQYYQQAYEGVFKIATLLDYEDYLMCIVNLDEANYKEESKELEIILERLNNEAKVKFNVAQTGVISNFTEFNKRIQIAANGFKYGFIYGGNQIFTEERILSYERDTKRIDKKNIQNIEFLFKSQKYNLLKNALLELFNHIRENGYNYSYIYNSYIQIIGMVSNECTLQNLSDDRLSQQALLQAYSKITDSEECLNWLYEVIDQFSENITLRNTSIGGTLVEELLAYIEANVDSQLSLNSVADYFGLSTGHLSRLFKEKVGTNFSDYVINIKFKKAESQLLANPKKKISDIAEEIGYANLTYFTKLFKEKYGMTPTQYRKLHVSSDEDRVS